LLVLHEQLSSARHDKALSDSLVVELRQQADISLLQQQADAATAAQALEAEVHAKAGLQQRFDALTRCVQ